VNAHQQASGIRIRKPVQKAGWLCLCLYNDSIALVVQTAQGLSLTEASICGPERCARAHVSDRFFMEAHGANRPTSVRRAFYYVHNGVSVRC